ncbi:Ferroxidase [Phocaeicola salanitronis DSM 18170]|jgi:ferritin|uniref:Ferritin n=1 Tax=Phocaeicola salanitronis (strain DSM 18170 / JCM 13657 / CCUG 60908 / BL78) TaxID=667015 RepID=F0R3J4_PHOSB|nr:ferritin [Phocaeicola salanitronis]ADY36626.1 Ferroxidase [Phocaeicola salanitronis DSM 18170]
MISEKLQNAMNEQITAEMWSSNLYLSMSFYLQKEGFDGFAHWMRKQSQEELQHAYDLADYIAKRGGAAKVDKIDVVPQGWGSVLEVFEHVYNHECHVSELIDNLVNVASGEKDKASQDFLWGYVREQVEEEATAQGIVDKLKKCSDYAGILYLNDKLGARE